MSQIIGPTAQARSVETLPVHFPARRRFGQGRCALDSLVVTLYSRQRKSQRFVLERSLLCWPVDELFQVGDATRGILRRHAQFDLEPEAFLCARDLGGGSCGQFAPRQYLWRLEITVVHLPIRDQVFAQRRFGRLWMKTRPRARGVKRADNCGEQHGIAPTNRG